MKFYETTIVLDPKIGDEEIEKNIQQAEQLITSGEGEVVEIDRKGVRKLAYAIKKQKNASHVVVYAKSKRIINMGQPNNVFSSP